jgi:hypothetical protein
VKIDWEWLGTQKTALLEKWDRALGAVRRLTRWTDTKPRAMPHKSAARWRPLFRHLPLENSLICRQQTFPICNCA